MVVPNNQVHYAPCQAPVLSEPPPDSMVQYPVNYQVPNPYMMPLSNLSPYHVEQQYVPVNRVPMYVYHQAQMYSVPPPSHPSLQYYPSQPAPPNGPHSGHHSYPYYQEDGSVYYPPQHPSIAAHHVSPSYPSHMFQQYPSNPMNGYVPAPQQQMKADPPVTQEKKEKKKDDSWNKAVAVMERERIIREKIGLLINGRYRVVQKINVGSYGAIYTALILSDPGQGLVAVKFETASVEDSHLHYEHEVYKVCHDGPRSKKCKVTEGFAKVHWIGEEYRHKIMVMELLGPSLENLFTYCSSRFKKETIYELGMQMIARVEHLHNRGFVHRDLKPENFLMGLGSNENTCYLIDFGLARRYREGHDLSHVPFRKGRNLVGTAKYASLRSHYGLELSRRDDLESLGYILLEFMIGELPWKEPRNRARFRSKQQSYNRIMVGKEQMNWKTACPPLEKWITYARGMNFTEKPDYNLLRNILRSYLMKPDEVYLEELFDNFTLERREPRNMALLAEEPIAKDDETRVFEALEELPVELVERVRNERFEWIERRDSSASERYTYECLFRWTLPYGKVPILPPNYISSMRFGYGIGEGGFA
ncbi:unnamed protein product [Auanema sp. JU1783]|nr:unnamed protein product [Auanema sp. JU1783]